MSVNKAYPVTKLLPVENIILGNGKMPRQANDDMTIGLLAIMKKQISVQDGNIVYVLVSQDIETSYLLNYLHQSRVSSGRLYVCHPDQAFEIVQNVIANPDIIGDPTKPRKYVKLYIDQPNYTDLCLLPDGKSHSLQFSHRLLNEAAHYVDSISATVDMNLRG
ncbi:hypothetical protein D3C85_576690 [compost metagenome]